MTGFSIGRPFGIDLRVDPSWGLIFLLVTISLASTLGSLHSDWSNELRLLVATLASLLVFASVLAHEYAHALMAKAQGIPVKSITLFMFGGVANIQREPHSPRAEFLITIVGPLASFAIGVVCIYASGALGLMADTVQDLETALAGLGPIGTMLLLLGGINISLAIFNLLPGFPLDGGRILRSLLWAWTGDLTRATAIAAFTGQLTAWWLIASGIAMVFGVTVPIFGTGTVGGIWLALIGWFINGAAVANYRQVLFRDLLDGVSVGQMMYRDPPTVPPGLAVADFVYDQVIGTDDHSFPVIDGGHLVGIVTLEDLRRVPRSEWQDHTVASIMTPVDALQTTTADTPAEDALAALQTKDVRMLPVLTGGRLVGGLRRRDVLRWLQIHGNPDGNPRTDAVLGRMV